MNPIIPFEPTICESIPQGSEWIAQIKWDGVRILTYFDGQQVQLFNRRGNERTWHYPEITDIATYSSATSLILDGEVISLGSTGKPSFHEVMRRDGIRRLEKVSHIKSQVPITYMIFDILFVNGDWVNHLPLRDRMELLQQWIMPSEHIQLVTSHPDGHALYKVVQEHQLEGIVLKDLTSSYLINGKDKRWQKKKYYRDLIAVIGGVTFRDQVVNSLLLGLYTPDGHLHYIGHAGTGKLTNADWLALTQVIKPLLQKEMPFMNRPDRYKDASWLSPELTVKVHFAEWTSGLTLRQPSIQAFVDVPAQSCRFDV
ncbi:DNA ligase [Brevibacillus laterosporus]|uniref:ATP-dependent DNA ligase n=1 Tax=Brevibacillus laterosporus TaxID=1465 RepID=UPI0035A608D3